MRKGCGCNRPASFAARQPHVGDTSRPPLKSSAWIHHYLMRVQFAAVALRNGREGAADMEGGMRKVGSQHRVESTGALRKMAAVRWDRRQDRCRGLRAGVFNALPHGAAHRFGSRRTCGGDQPALSYGVTGRARRAFELAHDPTADDAVRSAPPRLQAENPDIEQAGV
jgi:hypothetical protein